MKIHLKQTGGLLAILALGGSALAAQEASRFDANLKLHAGYGLTEAKDYLNRRTLGFGFDLGYTTSVGRFSVELGYYYKPGSQYLVDLSNALYAQGSDPVDPDPTLSVDSRKNQVGGIMARLGYDRAFAGSALGYRIGVQLGGSKYRQEYMADVADAGYAEYEDTYNGTVTKTTIAVSPYIGLTYTINEASGLELNVLFQSYTSANYVHVAGTVQGSYGAGNTGQDYVTTKKYNLPTIELGYTFRF